MTSLLCGQQQQHVCHVQAKGKAARALSYLLVNNDQGKEAMLSITPQTGQAEISEISDNTWPMNLLHQAVSVASAGVLLLCWLIAPRLSRKYGVVHGSASGCNCRHGRAHKAIAADGIT